MLSANPKLDQLFAEMEAGGRRLTRQRGAVCSALLAHGGHPTATEIWEIVHARWPSISHATIYNTITMLEELRLIRKIEIAGDENAHYDLETTPHVNVTCICCGQIADVYTDSLEALLGLVASKSGYCFDPPEGMIMYGRCAACARLGLETHH